MITTILIFVLFFVLLSAVGLTPAQNFTVGQRGIVSTVIFCLFLWWAIKHFALM